MSKDDEKLSFSPGFISMRGGVKTMAIWHVGGEFLENGFCLGEIREIER